VSTCLRRAFPATQRFRLHATNVSTEKITRTVENKVAAINFSNMILTSIVKFVSSLGIAKAGCSIKVPLERSSSADVQGYAMEPTAQHFGVSQFQGDDIKTLFLHKFDQGRLVLIDHDHIRINAE